MASIYENAYLVIASSHALDGSIGCFSERSGFTGDLIPCSKLIIPGNNKVPIYLRPEKVNEHSCYMPGSEFVGGLEHLFPLLCRAWAFQERLLATRMLHFGECLV
jgi:hypothetical protein